VLDFDYDGEKHRRQDKQQATSHGECDAVCLLLWLDGWLIGRGLHLVELGVCAHIGIYSMGASSALKNSSTKLDALAEIGEGSGGIPQQQAWSRLAGLPENASHVWALYLMPPILIFVSFIAARFLRSKTCVQEPTWRKPIALQMPVFRSRSPVE